MNWKLYTLTALLIFSTSLNAESTVSTYEQTQNKIQDAARSAAELASEFANDAQKAFSMGIKKGKVESLLFFNKHLNGYKIDVELNENSVTLSGTVSTGIEKSLAEELALSIDGIDNVQNQIKVSKELERHAKSPTTGKVTSTLKDLSISTMVKARLIANRHISALDIGVNTSDRRVILDGVTKTSIERDLAEQIAANTSGVTLVVNKIKVIEN